MSGTISKCLILGLLCSMQHCTPRILPRTVHCITLVRRYWSTLQKVESRHRFIKFLLLTTTLHCSCRPVLTQRQTGVCLKPIETTMPKNKKDWNGEVCILKRQLRPSAGCTESLLDASGHAHTWLPFGVGMQKWLQPPLFTEHVFFTPTYSNKTLISPTPTVRCQYLP